MVLGVSPTEAGRAFDEALDRQIEGAVSRHVNEYHPPDGHNGGRGEFVATPLALSLYQCMNLDCGFVITERQLEKNSPFCERCDSDVPLAVFPRSYPPLSEADEARLELFLEDVPQSPRLGTDSQA